MDGDDLPKPAIVDVLIFVSQDIADADDRAPWNVRITIGHRRRLRFRGIMAQAPQATLSR